ncbi:hypothetical protein AO377_1838 [Moraxella catarrhalis]|nr:hypothetical protein AO377_1838 [Moraxella catarrhalis]
MAPTPKTVAIISMRSPSKTPAIARKPAVWPCDADTDKQYKLFGPGKTMTTTTAKK